MCVCICVLRAMTLHSAPTIRFTYYCSRFYSSILFFFWAVDKRRNTRRYWYEVEMCVRLSLSREFLCVCASIYCFRYFWLTFYSPIHYIHLHARSHWTMALMSSFHTGTRFWIGFVSSFASIAWQWWRNNNNIGNIAAITQQYFFCQGRNVSWSALLSHTLSLTLPYSLYVCVCVRMRFSKTMKIIHNINFCFTYGSLAPRLLHFDFALRIFISLVQWSMLCLCYYFFVIYIDCSTCAQTYMCVRVCLWV